MGLKSFRITLLAALLLVAGQGGLTAQRVRLPRGMPEHFKVFKSYNVDGNITRVELFNGLTLLVEELPVSPIVAIVTCFRVGHFDDASSPMDPEIYSEAVLSRLATQVAPVGGVGEVQVRPYHSVYSTVVPEDNLSKTLEIHKGLFEAGGFTEKELESARRLVGNRRADRRLSWRTLHERILAWEMGGAGNLEAKASNPSAAVEFRKMYYAPSNAVIVVTGAARSELVLRRVAELFAPLPNPESPYTREEKQDGISLRGGFDYRLEREAIDRALVIAGYRTPGINQSDYPGVEIIRYILGEGNAALLSVPVRLGKPRRFEFRIDLKETRSGTQLMVALSTETENLEAAESRFLAAVRSVREGVLPPLVINRAKSLMLIDYYTRLGTPDSRARLLAEAEAWGDYHDRDRFPARIAALTGEKIRSIAARYLRDDNLQLVELIPVEAEERSFTETSFLETMNILVPTQVTEYRELFELIGSEDAPFRIPDFQVSFNSSPMRRSSILRGPEIYLKEEHTLPLVRLGIFFPGGRIEETDRNLGITDVVLMMIQRKMMLEEEGVGIFRLERLGCRLGYLVENDFFGLTAGILSANLEDAFPVLVGLHQNLEITDEEAEAAVREMVRRLALRDAPENEAEEEALARFYGSHPYGAFGRNQALSIRGLKREHLEEWRREKMVKSHPYIVVSGDVQGTSFLNDFVSTLSDSSLRVRRAVSKKPVTGNRRTNPVVELRKPDSLLMVFQGPEMGSHFREMADIAGILLGGRWGYIFRRLEELGTSVDNVSVKVINELNSGTIIITLIGEDAMLEKARANVRKILSEIPDNAVPRVPFLNAKVGAITRSHLIQLDPARILPYTMKAVLAGETADYARNYILNIRQIRLGEVESVIRRYLRISE